MPLEAKKVFYRYAKSSGWVLEDCSFFVRQGERVAVLGPSGCGKSTLAKLLAGYEVPERGQILCARASLPNKGRQPVWLIHQHPEQAVNPRWRMQQVLDECGGVSKELLSQLGIEPAWLLRYPGELSGGELQRFCVARALAVKPAYLICDEITTMLDVVCQAQLWEVILSEAKKNGMGLVVITHNEALAARVAERVVHFPLQPQ